MPIAPTNLHSTRCIHRLRQRLERTAAVVLALVPVAATLGCAGARQSVTLYVSVDEPYARPVIEAFTKETGVRVRPVFDTEANKSRGLAQRILAERNRPRADVWWSSEVMQTVGLRNAGALAPYRPHSAEGIPAKFRDKDNYWTGFAGRFRVLVANNRLAKSQPRGLEDLADPKWKGQVAMANPLFGSTTTEAAALFQLWGPARATDYYRRRAANRTVIVDGNSVSAEQAARGEVAVGQTDTDDAYIRVDHRDPITVIFPDADGMGTLLIPNTAALVKGAPNPEGGKRLIEYLLRSETELQLAAGLSRQLPLHPNLGDRVPERVRPLAAVKTMPVDYSRLDEQADAADRVLRELFVR